MFAAFVLAGILLLQFRTEDANLLHVRHSLRMHVIASHEKNLRLVTYLSKVLSIDPPVMELIHSIHYPRCAVNHPRV